MKNHNSVRLPVLCGMKTENIYLDLCDECLNDVTVIKRTRDCNYKYIDGRRLQDVEKSIGELKKFFQMPPRMDLDDPYSRGYFAAYQTLSEKLKDIINSIPSGRKK